MNLDSAIAFVHGGYFLIFLGILIEGPIINTAAGFLSSQGFFNAWIIIAIATGANFLGDLLHYTGGYYLGNKLIKKKESSERLVRLLHSNLWKSIILVKVTPPLSTPGLVIAGALKVPIWRFAFVSLFICLPLALFYTGIGYFSGSIIGKVLTYLKIGQWILFFAIIFFIIAYFLYKRLDQEIAKKISG